MDALLNGSAFVPVLKRLYKQRNTLSPDFDRLKPGTSTDVRLFNWRLLLDAMEQLGMPVSSDTAALIMASDETTLRTTLAQLKQRSQNTGAVDLSKLHTVKELHEAENSLEFLLLSLCRAFDFTAAQAAGLLAEEAKLLKALQLNGLKKDFRPLTDWLRLFRHNLSHLAELLKAEPTALPLVFKLLQPGLQSKDPESVKHTLKSLTELSVQLKAEKLQLLQLANETALLKNAVDSYLTVKPRMLKTFGQFLVCYVQQTSEVTEYLYTQAPLSDYYDVCLYLLAHHFLKINEAAVVKLVDRSIEACDKGSQADRLASLGFVSRVWVDFLKSIDEERLNLLVSAAFKLTVAKTWPMKYSALGWLLYLFEHLLQSNDSAATLVFRKLAQVYSESNQPEIRDLLRSNLNSLLPLMKDTHIRLLVGALKKYGVVTSMHEFDLTIGLSRHPALQIAEAVQLLKYLFTVYGSDSIYTRAAEIPITLLISRFIYSEELHTTLTSQISTRLQVTAAQARPLLALVKRLLKFNHTELTAKLKKVCELGPEDLVRKVLGEDFGKTRYRSVPPRSKFPDVQARYREIPSRHQPLALQVAKTSQVKLKPIVRTDRSHQQLKKILYSVPKASALFNQEDESEFDRELLNLVFLQNKRLSAALFSDYSTTPNPDSTSLSMGQGDICKFMRDCGVSKDSMSTEEIRSLYQQIISRHKVTRFKHEDFVNFIYQVAVRLYSTKERDLRRYPTAISVQAFLKNMAHTKLPYQSPGDPELIKLLNAKLKTDPHTPLPEGYRRSKEEEIVISHASPSFMPEPSRIVLEILDELFLASVGTHLLQPIVSVVPVYRATAVLHKPRVTEATGTAHHKAEYRAKPIPVFLKLTPMLKLEVAKLASQEKQEDLLTVAQVIDDLTHSVHSQSQVLISRNPKPAGSLSNQVIRAKLLDQEAALRTKQKTERNRLLRKRHIAEELEKIKKVRESQFKETQEQLARESQREQEITLKAKSTYLKSKEERTKVSLALQEKKALREAQRKEEEELRLQQVNLKRRKDREFLDRYKSSSTNLSKTPAPLVLFKEQVSTAKADADVQQLLSTYRDSLQAIFTHYTGGRRPHSGIFSLFASHFNIVPFFQTPEEFAKLSQSLLKEKGEVDFTTETFEELLLRLSLLVKPVLETEFSQSFTEYSEAFRRLLTWLYIPRNPRKTIAFLKKLEQSVQVTNARDKLRMKNELLAKVSSTL